MTMQRALSAEHELILVGNRALPGVPCKRQNLQSQDLPALILAGNKSFSKILTPLGWRRIYKTQGANANTYGFQMGDGQPSMTSGAGVESTLRLGPPRLKELSIVPRQR